MVNEDDTYVIHGPKPSEPLPTDCLGKFILQDLIDNPTNEVMVCAHTGKTISYKQILQETCNLAESLRVYGCTDQTIIGLCSENHLKFFIPLLAAAANGSIIVPINPAYIQDELKHVLNLTQPKILFCSKITVGKFLQNKDDFHFIEKIIVIDSQINNVETMDDFIKNQLEGRSVDPKTFKIFNGDPATHVQAIMTSSGTTGLPKGVMITDHGFEIRILQFRDPVYNNSGFYYKDPSNSIQSNTVERPKGTIGLMPFYHGAGIVLGLACVAHQIQLLVISKFDEDLFLKAIQDYKLESLALPPPLVVFLAKSPKVDRYDLSRLKKIGSGSAPLNKETELLLKKRLPNIQGISQGYGLTEYLAASLGTCNDADKEGSVGLPSTFTSIKIRDSKSGKSLGPNQAGEICIKGPLMMTGYYKNEKATKESFTSDGWLKSGDIGYYDDDRYLFIIDRLKELIKYKGYQVPPAEIEALLIHHPKVLDAGVVGLLDEVAGELPIAFVVKKPGVDLTEKELQDYVAGKVSPQKKLRGGVIFVSAIPKNQAGKILRRELRKQLSKYKINKKSKL